MIESKDRSWWFGASDTDKVVGNWSTASWKKWWLEKLALSQNDLSTKAMKVGNAFEHKILEHISGNLKMDKQILIPELRLRVNLDGNTDVQIIEVKTHKSESFKVSKTYWRQAQVEMFAFQKETGILPDLFIAAYHVTEEDYKNYFRPIDEDRLQLIPVEYDRDFITELYIPKLMYLGECLEKGKMP